MIQNYLKPEEKYENRLGWGEVSEVVQIRRDPPPALKE